MNMFGKSTLSKILSLALVFIFAMASVNSALAAPDCDPTDGVSCWKLNYDSKTATWQGPTDGSADVFQKGAVLGLIRAGWKFVVPSWTVPGNMEICVGDVINDGTKLAKNNCDGTDLAIKPGKIVVTDSTGDSGGFRIRPAEGYGYNSAAPVATVVPTAVPESDQPVTPRDSNDSNAFGDWLFMGIMTFAGLIWVLGNMIYAFVAFKGRFGLIWGFVAAAVTFFVAGLPCIGFPLTPIAIWLLTRPKTVEVVAAPAV